jgi:hypothetical protein
VIKKVGMVTVGITAGLLAAAPFASAGEAHGHDGGHHGGHGHHGSSDCNINGGNAEANGGIGGDAGVGALAQAPVGANALNLVCSNVLNDNLSGNALSVSILGADDEEEAVASTAGEGAGEGAGSDPTGALSGETLAF